MEPGKMYVMDEARLSQTLIDAMAKGQAELRDGVAYWKTGGIIQHIPMKQVPVSEAQAALAGLGGTMTAAAAISVGVVLIAMVVATKYVAGKIDSVQAVVDEISSEIKAQNLLFYLDKPTAYAGSVEAAHSLLSMSREKKSELADVAGPMLATLATQRRQLLRFLRDLLSIAHQQIETDDHFELVLKFACKVLDFVPIGIQVETMLAERVEKNALADHTMVTGAQEYRDSELQLKELLNGLHEELRKGKLKKRLAALSEVDPHARALFGSEVNKLVLARADMIVASRDAARKATAGPADATPMGASTGEFLSTLVR